MVINGESNFFVELLSAFHDTNLFILHVYGKNVIIGNFSNMLPTAVFYGR